MPATVAGVNPFGQSIWINQVVKALRYAAHMGNREALLAGATQCLIERGWAHTTVRDIAAAAGVNHAAIGYHFGSKDALLTQALVAAVEALGDELANTPADPPERRWQA